MVIKRESWNVKNTTDFIDWNTTNSSEVKQKNPSEWFFRMHQLTSKWRIEKVNTFYVIVIKHIDYLLDLLKFYVLRWFFSIVKTHWFLYFIFWFVSQWVHTFFNQNTDKIVTYFILFPLVSFYLFFQNTCIEACLLAKVFFLRNKSNWFNEVK